MQEQGKYNMQNGTEDSSETKNHQTATKSESKELNVAWVSCIVQTCQPCSTKALTCESKSMGTAKVPHKFLGPVDIEALNGFGVLYFVTGLLATARSHA